jgi:hypothetical protein
MRGRQGVRKLKVVNLGLPTYVAARDTALCVGLSASWRVATAGEGAVTYIQIGLRRFIINR